MGCGCRQRQRSSPSILAEPGAPTTPLPAGGWSWRVLLPDGTVESGYDELGAVRRAKEADGTYEAVLPGLT